MLWMMGMALAGFTVEGPPVPSRGDANAEAKAVKEAGLKGRIVRRYRDGAGWEFIVRLEGFDDVVSAREAAKTLAKTVSGEVVVRGEDGEVIHMAEGTAPPPASPEPAPETPPEPVATGGSSDWIDNAIEAHGGRADLAKAERVKLVYTREMADGRVAKHSYGRRGTDLYLMIEGVKGKVADSATLALDEKAWLTSDGKSTTEDLQRARETVERFGPLGAVPIVLALESASNEAPALTKLRERGTAKVNGTACNAAGADDLMVCFGAKTGLILRVAMNGEGRVIEYSDYKDVGDLKVPHRVVTLEDGEIANTVVIGEIEVDGALPDAWFTPPGE